MYSRGKEQLEKEKNKQASEEDQRQKALADNLARIEQLRKDLETYKNIPMNQLHLIDSQYVNKLTDGLDAVLESTSENIHIFLGEIAKTKTGGEETFRNAANQLLKAANDLSPMLEEIRIVLNQIWRAVSADAELKRSVLLDLQAELHK